MSFECPRWETVSALMDGELVGTELAEARNHANSCPSCSTRYRRALTFQTVGSHASIAGTVAPLKHATAGERRWLTGRWTRWSLLAVSVVIVAEAAPAFVQGTGLGADGHAARHLATWQIGFGVGLLVAAWMSRLSHAMLALAATFATLTITATVFDILTGHQGPWAESVHLIELVAVVLLWRMTPAHLLPWRRGNEFDPPRDRITHKPAGDPTLRVVAPDPIMGPEFNNPPFA